MKQACRAWRSHIEAETGRELLRWAWWRQGKRDSDIPQPTSLQHPAAIISSPFEEAGWPFHTFVSEGSVKGKMQRAG